jgi:hypothetical protein
VAVGAAGQEAIGGEVLKRGEEVLGSNWWFRVDDAAGEVSSGELDVVTDRGVYGVKNHNWYKRFCRDTAMLRRRVQDWGRQIDLCKAYVEATGSRQEVALWVSKVPQDVANGPEIRAIVQQVAAQKGVPVVWYTP